MALVTFWIALSGLVYVYFGYPLLLLIWCRLARRPVHKAQQEPTVSLVIAMHNERARVHQRLQNCLTLDYPPEKLQIIVALDAPTDGTDGIVAGYGKSIEVVHSTRHIGKAAALNQAMAVARGELVIFTDARQQFETNVIRELAANFSDPAVGAVSGGLILLDEHGHEAGDSASAYWRYEKKLRAMESAIHSVPGATGAIYAIRRKLFQPLPPRTILDDVLIPMRIVLAGWRAVFDPAARAYDIASASPEHEYLRKRRTLAGNYQLLVELPELLLPWRNPIFVQFVSHKVGRLLSPYCLVALFIANLFLEGPVYRTILGAQVLWYALAAAGWLISTRTASQRILRRDALDGRSRL